MAEIDGNGEGLQGTRNLILKKTSIFTNYDTLGKKSQFVILICS